MGIPLRTISMPGGSNRRLESLLHNELLDIEDINKGSNIIGSIQCLNRTNKLYSMATVCILRVRVREGDISTFATYESMVSVQKA